MRNCQGKYDQTGVKREEEETDKIGDFLGEAFPDIWISADTGG